MDNDLHKKTNAVKTTSKTKIDPSLVKVDKDTRIELGKETIIMGS